MRKYVNDSFRHFIHGADYNPEQWLHDKSIWDKDMVLMRGANCNEMTVGIFSWAILEPKEGEYDFSFLDEIIDKIYINGGRVVLATPSGSRPRWMAEKYPEVLRVDERGVRAKFNRRHNHCMTSPVYREKVARMDKILAERYGKHPAVIAYHVSNEFGGECFCPLCIEAFRAFLKERYSNDIEKLNFAYWSTFWSLRFNSFEEILPPAVSGETSIIGLNLDWRRFVSKQTAYFLRVESEALKSVTPNIPVTTNMMPAVLTTNYWDFEPFIDVASWDTYPLWHSPIHSEECVRNAFWNDFFRTLKKRPFMLMESCPGATNWQDINKTKKPGMMRLASLQTVAHGGDSVQYFQFRKGRGGVEQYHGAIVDHVGDGRTRAYREVAAIGETLGKIEEVLGSMPDVKVAVIYDWETRWALDIVQTAKKYDQDYHKTVYDYYRVLFEHGISADIVNSHADLSSYSLVIAPMLYITDEACIDKLSAYVRGGGTLYATYMLGMANESDLAYLGGFPGGELKNVFGIWNEEIDALYDSDTPTVSMGGESFDVCDMLEVIHSEGAEILAEYSSDFYAGGPALTKNSYGNGTAYYQAFRDTGAFKDKILGEILESLSIKGAVPKQDDRLVTAHTRVADGETYIFLENYSPSQKCVDIGYPCLDMETGEKSDSFTVSPFGCRVLKKI